MNKKYRPLNEVFEEQTPYHFIFDLEERCHDLGIDWITECIMIPTFISENFVKFAGLIGGHSAEFDIHYIEDDPIFILKLPVNINVISFKYKNLNIDKSESIKEFKKFKSNKTLISNPLIDYENKCFNIDILKHALGKRCVVKYIYKDIEHEEIMDFRSHSAGKTQLKFYNNGSMILFNIDMPHIDELEIYELNKIGSIDTDK